MIVLDASVVLDLLLDRPTSARVQAVLGGSDGEVAAPHLVDAEIGQVLRRSTGRGELGAAESTALLEDYLDLPLVRYPHAPLLRRAYELRDNVTVCDGLYLALAEGLGCPLLTAHRSLAALPGCRAEVDLLTG